MSMHERLLQEKAKEHDLKEKVRLAQEAFEDSARTVVAPTGCDKDARRVAPTYRCEFHSFTGFESEQVPASNRRAKRSTKGEMQIRRRIVTKGFVRKWKQYSQ